MKIWKSLGYSFKSSLKELFSFLCTLITFVILISFKTDDQLAALTLLVKSKDYITLFLITMGLIALSHLTEYLIKGLFWLVKTLFLFLLKKLKNGKI